MHKPSRILATAALAATLSLTGAAAATQTKPDSPPPPGPPALRLKGCPVVAKEYVHQWGQGWTYNFIDIQNPAGFGDTAHVNPHPKYTYYFCPRPGADTWRERYKQYCQSFTTRAPSKATKPRMYSGAWWWISFQDKFDATVTKVHRMLDNSKDSQCSIHYAPSRGTQALGWLHMRDTPQVRIHVVHKLAGPLNGDKEWMGHWQALRPCAHKVGCDTRLR